MDPLSFTASLLAVTQLTLATISLCNDYRSRVEQAPKVISRIVSELISLHQVLENLIRLAEGEDASRLPILKSLNAPNGPLAECKVELDDLKTKLGPLNKWKALLWPLKEGEILKTVAALERIKTTLQLGLTTDSIELALATQDNVVALTHDVTALAQSFERVTLDNTRREVHKWLNAPDPSSNHSNACKKGLPTTCAWFLEGEAFGTWKSNLGSFLWLRGIPGCGKTILCSMIIEDVLDHCQTNPSLSIAYFYFDFNDVEKQHHENLIRSLITQLSSQCATCPNALMTLYSQRDNGGQQPKIDELLRTLRSILLSFHHTYIVMDALDECAHREELLAVIEEIIGWELDGLCMLATSRPERDIEDCLGSRASSRVDFQPAVVDTDIRAHVHHQLQSDAKLKKWPVKVQHEIETVLTDGSHGMFRWAVCQLDALRKCIKLDALRKTMRGLPKTLEETYNQILLGIEEEHKEDAFRILQCLVFSCCPLTVAEVVEVLATKEDDRFQFDSEQRLPDPRDILTICSSLVSLSGNTQQSDIWSTVVQLSHLSVKEFLISSHNSAYIHPFFDEMRAHRDMAHICLAYLLQLEKDMLLVHTAQDFPLAPYSARYWVAHAKSGGSLCELKPLIRELLQSGKHFYANLIQFRHPNNADFASPLYYVAFYGLDKAVQWILCKDIVIDLKNEDSGKALQAASYEGHSKVVNILLEAGADPNMKGGFYMNALQAASLKGHDKVVQALLDTGADVHIQGRGYGNALQAASIKGHSKVVQMLLDVGADVNLPGGYYGNALQAASTGAHKEVVKMLLDKGGNVNLQGGHYGNAFQAAAAAGHKEVFQMLLSSGADVNIQGGFYGNVLQGASFAGCKEVVQMALDAGVDVNMPGGHYGSALQAAACKGHREVVQLLLDTEADINMEGGYYGNAIQAASHRGYKDMVQMLVDAGADVNMQGGYYGNALQAASSGGYREVMQILLDAGADVNMQGGIFGNALQAATSGKSKEVVQILLNAGADVNIQGGMLGNALQAASFGGYKEVVQTLLHAGADVNMQSGPYGSALQAASYCGHKEVVQALLYAGIDVNIQNGPYGNALQAALHEGHEEVVQMLLHAGVDVNMQNEPYDNALQAAASGGHQDMMWVLLDSGANPDVLAEMPSSQ